MQTGRVRRVRANGWSSTLAAWVISSVLAVQAFAQSVSVTLPPAEKPWTGRVLVYLISDKAKVGRADPIDAIFEQDPQPIFGMDVAGVGGGQAVVVGEKTEGFLPAKVRATLGELPPGSYRLQAALVLNREEDWKDAPGNYYSEVAQADLGPGKSVSVKLTERTERRRWPQYGPGGPGTSPVAEEFTLKSKLLSDFWHHDVIVRAGVRPPRKLEPGKKYPAIYEIPGFGGDHFSALYPSMRGGAAGQALADSVYKIVLNPNSPYGHTFFMDSDNIGPWARALREELIPALEAKYALVSAPEARLLRGHSSGGWSTLWLATEYPETFGATWSTSPDPVDFRRFEMTDIYGVKSFFEENGVDTPSARIGGGAVTMTVRQEFTQEDVIGPHYTSAQQWASWQACWGHRNADGTLHPLFDRLTGDIDKVEAESYRRFDIADRLRRDPAHFVPIFRNNVRLFVGEKDDYYLNEAVHLLAADLDRLDPAPTTAGAGAGADGKSAARGPGYIHFIPGTTHQTVLSSPAAWAIGAEMVEHLRLHGLLPK